jgi:mRNA interferase RelE/StbE
MYEIIFTKVAKEQFLDLNKNVKKEVINKLRRVSKNPQKELLKLRSNEYYYFRISAYRIIVNLKQKELIVEIIKIGHRGFIYKEMDI